MNWTAATVDVAVTTLHQTTLTWVMQLGHGRLERIKALFHGKGRPDKNLDS
jgi:hypothetical protein